MNREDKSEGNYEINETNPFSPVPINRSLVVDELKSSKVSKTEYNHRKMPSANIFLSSKAKQVEKPK